MNSAIRQTFFYGVLLAVPIASYVLVFMPQNAEIAKARQEIEHKKAMLDKLRQATSQTEDLQRANQQIRERIEAIELRLPTDKEMDDVLRQVTALATKTNLKVPHFKKADKPLSAGLAMEQQIDVEITGDFDGFYRFLLELEQLPRITRIPDLAIKRSDKTDGEMEAKFTLSIYYEGDGTTP